MGGFEVSVPAVDALSFRVAVAASDVRSALGGVQAPYCIDTGDAALSGALSSFQQFWSSFTEETAHVIDGTAGNIANAAATYQQVDSTVMVNPELTSAFMQSAGSGGAGMSQLLLGPLLGGGRP